MIKLDELRNQVTEEPADWPVESTYGWLTDWLADVPISWLSDWPKLADWLADNHLTDWWLMTELTSWLTN